MQANIAFHFPGPFFLSIIHTVSVFSSSLSAFLNEQVFHDDKEMYDKAVFYSKNLPTPSIKVMTPTTAASPPAFLILLPAPPGRNARPWSALGTAPT